MKRIFLLLIIFSIVLGSCHFFGGKTIRGNGVAKTETRTAGSFNSIDVSGNINVYVKQDSSTSIKVEADEDLMEYIIIESDNNTLYIKPRDGANLRSSNGIKVYISNAMYKSFEASGACDIYGENKISSTTDMSIDATGASGIEMDLHAPAVVAEATGASNILLKGETKNFKAEATGASSIKCFGLMTENADVDISGASHADVFASMKLEASASGASGIQYKGNAAVTPEASGASSVKKAD